MYIVYCEHPSFVNGKTEVFRSVDGLKAIYELTRSTRKETRLGIRYIIVYEEQN